MTLPSYEDIASRFSYCPETGVVSWKGSSRGVKAGRRAGSVTSGGYVRLEYKKKGYQAHRIAWLLTHKEWPKQEIDHINGIRSDNRICNLRACSHKENLQNLNSESASSSGLRGVCFHKRAGKWMAQITSDGVNHYLGLHSTIAEARAAYLAAKSRLHDFQPVPRSASAQDEMAQFAPTTKQQRAAA